LDAKITRVLTSAPAWVALVDAKVVLLFAGGPPHPTRAVEGGGREGRGDGRPQEGGSDLGRRGFSPPSLAGGA